ALFWLNQSSSNVVIENLTFDGAGLYAEYGSAENVTVRHNVFKDMTGRGFSGPKYEHLSMILVKADAPMVNWRIEHNLFTNIHGDNGIFGHRTKVVNTYIENNVFDSVHEGIHIFFKAGSENI